MSESSQKKALDTAANVLSYRNRSATSLYDRLVEKGIGPEDAAYAVERLISLGLLDDAAYAASLCTSLKAKGYGPGRVRAELKKQKLDQDLIEEAMEAFSPDQDKLSRFIASKLKGQAPDRAALKRVSDGLFRRGFSWDEIHRAVQSYLDQLEEDFVQE